MSRGKQGKPDMSESDETKAVVELTPATEAHVKKRSRRQRKRVAKPAHADSATDIEVPAPADDSDDYDNTDNNHAPALACCARVDRAAAEHVASDVSEAGVIYVRLDVGASCNAELSEEILPVIDSSESQFNATGAAPCAGVPGETDCRCGDENAWGCPSCAVYSSSLLLLHRDISIIEEQGPPGLEFDRTVDKPIIWTKTMFY
jgi:hypothetical protein